MGYQDRDYYRDGQATDAWGTSVVVKLIALNCLLFLANLFFGGRENVITGALQLQQAIDLYDRMIDVGAEVTA